MIKIFKLITSTFLNGEKGSILANHFMNESGKA